MTSEIWPGSRLSLSEAEFTGVLTTAPDTAVLAVMIVATIAVILFFGRFVSALGASFSIYRSSHGTTEILGNKYLCDSIRLTLVILVPFYALALWRAGVSPDYWIALLAAAGLLLFRKGIYALIAWLGSVYGQIKDVEKLSYGTAIATIALSLLPFLLVKFFPDIPSKAIQIYLMVVLISNSIVYSRRSAEIISSTGFSIFFWVLYLCTLELLPICVVANLMMYGH